MLNVFTHILAADNPADHVYNHVFLKSSEDWWLWSGNQGNLILSGIILTLGFIWIASKIKTGPKEQGAEAYITRSSTAHLVEVICVYLREEVARPLLHDRTNKLMPFLWTIFFFILVNNVLGLIPLLDLQHVLFPSLKAEHKAFIGGTATQNIWITGMLAAIAAVVFNVAAISRLGIGAYFKHMTGGAPFPISLIVFPIEFAGQILIKPVALAIRLFANMTAGHVLLATLLMFVGQVWGEGLLLKGPVTIVSVVGAVAIMFLELFVAFLQAFIFMFLVTVFISLMDHHDEHGHEHGDDHAPGHEHAHA